jgi:hypothetical protein
MRTNKELTKNLLKNNTCDSCQFRNITKSMGWCTQRKTKPPLNSCSKYKKYTIAMEAIIKLLGDKYNQSSYDSLCKLFGIVYDTSWKDKDDNEEST